MSTDSSTAKKRLVQLGPKEWAAAGRLSMMSIGVASPELGARTGVTIAAALDNACRVGFVVKLIGSDGRQYAYDLTDPKRAHELNQAGQRTGKKVNLIDLTPTPLPPQRPKLRRVK